MLRVLLSVVVLFFSGHAIAAKEYKQGALVLKDVFARPTIGKIKNSAAYLKIMNMGSTEDTLLSVSTDIASLTEIHTHKMENGSMMMMKVENPVVVPAKGSVEFKSGGLHIMLMGLKKTLKKGDTFSLTMTFEKHGKISVDVDVRKPNIGHMHHHSGHNM